MRVCCCVCGCVVRYATKRLGNIPYELGVTDTVCCVSVVCGLWLGATVLVVYAVVVCGCMLMIARIPHPKWLTGIRGTASTNTPAEWCSARGCVRGRGPGGKECHLCRGPGRHSRADGGVRRAAGDGMCVPVPGSHFSVWLGLCTSRASALLVHALMLSRHRRANALLLAGAVQLASRCAACACSRANMARTCASLVIPASVRAQGLNVFRLPPNAGHQALPRHTEGGEEHHIRAAPRRPAPGQDLAGGVRDGRLIPPRECDRCVYPAACASLGPLFTPL